jgi:Second Messenger Oligonucleotide or Dinucleotide Synthetase domain
VAATVTASFNALIDDLKLTARQREVADARVSHLQSYFSPPMWQIGKAPWVIGSYGRETLVRWERDLDVMVALSVPAYWESFKSDSRRYLYWVRDYLNKEYPDTKVSSKEVAVRMELSDNLQVDLVPAFARSGGGFYIPDGSKGWTSTNPPFHDELVADSNVRLDGSLKPLIRVMKAWNIANGGHLRSFHLEMMVERMWQTRTSMSQLPIALASTLAAAAGWANQPFGDPWMPTQRIDAYLTATDRTKVVGFFTTDGANAAKANEAEAAERQAEAVDLWDAIFARKSVAFH